MASLPKPTTSGFIRFLMYAVITAFILKVARPSLPASVQPYIPNL